MCQRAESTETQTQTKQGKGPRVGGWECPWEQGRQLFCAEDTTALTGVKKQQYGVWRKSIPGRGKGLEEAQRVGMNLAVRRPARRWIWTEWQEEETALSPEGLWLSRQVSWEPPGAWSRDSCALICACNTVADQLLDCEWTLVG